MEKLISLSLLLLFAAVGCVNLVQHQPQDAQKVSASSSPFHVHKESSQQALSDYLF